MAEVAPPSARSPTLSGEDTSFSMSAGQRLVLLLLYCTAQFMDAFSNTAIFSALPELQEEMEMNVGDGTWVVAAFTLTFSSFLLVSGRIADVYKPKFVFVIGVGGLGVLSLVAGFMNSKIPLIVLRALCGIFAALSIPSALTLLVKTFPEPTAQARAIGLFGGLGSIGVVLGLIIGAIFVQFTSWRWTFWFVAIMEVTVAAVAVVLVPPHQREDTVDSLTWSEKLRRLDLVGVSILTSSLILLIFAVTSGSTSGWGTAVVIAPLIISIFLISCFFYWESAIPAELAAIPPRTWRIPNFAVLIAVSLYPFFWYTALFTALTLYWQQVWHWSAISAAIHMIPIGATNFAISFTGPVVRRVSRKALIVSGQVLVLVAMVLLHFADRPEKYWRFVFPAFIIGSAGAMITYTHTNIAIFAATPPSMAGTVGAIFYCGLQLGAAVGIAAVTSIEATVNKRASGDAPGYHGLRAAYWFIFAADAALLVATAIFYRAEVRTTDAGGDHVGPAKWGEARPSELAGGSEMTHDISAHQRGDVGEKC